MAERVVKVKLLAQVQEYKAGMEQAAAATRTVGTEAEKLAQTRRTFDLLGKSMLTAGGLIAAGIGVAVAKFAEFDQAMSYVQAATHETAANMDLLSDAALAAGSRTVYSATESANAIEELAKAGLSTADILSGALDGSLDLAAAGGLAVARAAEIASTTLQQFKLSGDQAAHVADVLAAGAGKAMGSVEDLADGLKYVGPIASAMGVSVEEATGTLALFAQQGILGQQAGTSLRGVLMSLTSPSSAAAKEIERLGITLYDSQGNFLGLENAAGQLSTAYAGMTGQARDASLGIIFGNQQITAATALYQAGAAGVAEWTAAVDDAGYAADTAGMRLDNLRGDWEALTGSFDSALISMGSAADGPLRFLIQGITGLVDKFNELPNAGQQVVFWLGAAASAATLAGGAFLTGAPKIIEYQNAIDKLGPRAQKTGRLLGTLTTAAAAVGAALVITQTAATWVRDLEGTDDRITELAGANKSLADSLTYLDEVYAEHNVSSGFQGLVKLQENGWSRVTALWDGAVRDGADLQVALGELGTGLGSLATSNLPAAQAQFSKWAEATDGSEEQLVALLTAMGPYRDALVKVAQAQGVAVTDTNLLELAFGDAESATNDNTDALSELQGQAEDTDGAIASLSDTIKSFGSATLDAREAQRKFEEALDDAQDALEENGKSLDISTEAGRKNEAALDGIASAANNAAANILATTGSEELARVELERGREALIYWGDQFGMSSADAAAYADSVIADLGSVKAAVEGLPDSKAIEVTADGAQALSTLERIQARLGAITSKTVTVTTKQKQVGDPGWGVSKNSTAGNATGGAIVGPGSGTSDDILSWLSNGEHVLTAKDVEALGGQDAVYAFRRALHGGVLKYASGGSVPYKTWKVTQDEQNWFRSQMEDWNRDKARGETASGLGLVDQLLAISEQVQKGAHTRLRNTALAAEKAFVKLETQSEKAASKLEAAKDKLADLRDAAASMASKVTSAVRSLFSVGDLGASKQTATTQTVNGVRVSSTGASPASATTAGGIASSMKASAARIKQFATKLTQLSKKGLAAGLLAEIASLGVENGEPIVDALLTASAGEISTINSSYKAIDKYSAQAGDVVADANYEKLIVAAEKQVSSAQKNADKIDKQIKTQTDRLIKTITDSLKSGSYTTVKKASGGAVFGAGTATSDSVPAWLSNGEHVWTAEEVRAAGGHSAVQAMRQRVLVPTAARFAAGGPVGGATLTAAADLDKLADRIVVALASRPQMIVHNPVVKDLLLEARQEAQLNGGPRV